MNIVLSESDSDSVGESDQPKRVAVLEVGGTCVERLMGVLDLTYVREDIAFRDHTFRILVNIESQTAIRGRAAEELGHILGIGAKVAVNDFDQTHLAELLVLMFKATPMLSANVLGMDHNVSFSIPKKIGLASHISPYGPPRMRIRLPVRRSGKRGR